MSFTNMFTLGPSPLGHQLREDQHLRRQRYDDVDEGRAHPQIRWRIQAAATGCSLFRCIPQRRNLLPGLPTGNPSYEDFLAGLSGLSVIGSGTNSLHNRANDFSAFFQDDWKVSPRLTLNLGMRYDYFGPTTETDGHFVGFDPSKAVTTPLLYRGWRDWRHLRLVVTGGFVQAGNGNLPGIPKVSNGLVNPNYKNFGPRVGFAYQMTNNGNVVLRGGYGIFYDRPNMRLFNSQLFNMPYEMLATALATPNENPFVHVPLPSAFPLNPLSANCRHLPIWRISGLPAGYTVPFCHHALLSSSGHRALSGPARLEHPLRANLQPRSANQLRQ